MTRVHALLLTLSFVLAAGLSQAAAGPQCTEDILFINGEGCNRPCCYQDPPNSGHYIFAHDAVENIDIRGNPASVVSVSFPNLQSVEKIARIRLNQPGAITSISFPSLQTAGALDISRNPGLVEVDLPSLMTIVNDENRAFLDIGSNANLNTLNVPLLKSVTATDVGSAYIELSYNQALEEINFPNLKTIESIEDDSAEAYVFIGNNGMVRHISMNKLQRLSAGVESISYLIIDDMLNLEQLSFPHLTELLPTGDDYNFSELTIGHSPNLTGFVFPSLERVTVLQLTGLKGTREVMFPKLSELDYLWVFRSCANPYSTLKMYICSEQPIMDMLFSNDDGLCGPAGYMLYSSNEENLAACDASEVCQSFIPDVNECSCDGLGQCKVEPIDGG